MSQAGGGGRKGLPLPPTCHFLPAHTAPGHLLLCREGQMPIPAGTPCAVTVVTQAPVDVPCHPSRSYCPQSEGDRQPALAKPRGCHGWVPSRILLSDSLGSPLPKCGGPGVSRQKGLPLEALGPDLPQISCAESWVWGPLLCVSLKPLREVTCSQVNQREAPVLQMRKPRPSGIEGLLHLTHVRPAQSGQPVPHRLATFLESSPSFPHSGLRL